MADIIREAPLGQIVRWATNKKFLKYPEEEADFECPQCYRSSESADSLSVIEEKSIDLEPSDATGGDAAKNHQGKEKDLSPRHADHLHDLENLHTQKTHTTVRSSIDAEQDFEKLSTHKTNVTIRTSMGAGPSLTRTRTREMTRAYTRERFDIEKEERSLKTLNMPIVAQKNENGDILVDWYTTDDPANPQNWSSMKKLFVGSQIL